MSAIDSLYRSSLLFNQTIPTTDTFNTSFNYSIAENLYGENVLLYTGLIPSTNPLVSAGDGAKYSTDGIDVVEKIDLQEMDQVEESFFAFSHPRMTYLIPGSVYGISVWAKDSAGDYTIQVPQSFYDVFFYQKEQRYVIYFKEKYDLIYTNGALDNPSYMPAITCYRYCGPKGIENIPAGGGPQGATGAQGSSGPQGGAGANGPQGAQGPTGAGSSGPSPIILQYSGSYTASSTTFLNMPEFTVSGLEPNYLYMLKFSAEAYYNAIGSYTYTMNFKIRFLTQGGNETVMAYIAPSNSPWWHSPTGGFYGLDFATYNQLGHTFSILAVQDNNMFSSYGWEVDVTNQDWNNDGYINIDSPFITGSTSDLCSIKVDFALDKASGTSNIQLYDPIMVLEPIGPMP